MGAIKRALENATYGGDTTAIGIRLTQCGRKVVHRTDEKFGARYFLCGDVWVPVQSCEAAIILLHVATRHSVRDGKGLSKYHDSYGHYLVRVTDTGPFSARRLARLVADPSSDVRELAKTEGEKLKRGLIVIYANQLKAMGFCIDTLKMQRSYMVEHADR